MDRTIFRVSIAGIAGALAFSMSSRADTPNGVNATFGTTGLGVELNRKLTDKLAVRGVLSALAIQVDGTEDDIDYDVDIGLANFGAILDFHPQANPFRLSVGMVATTTGVDIESTTAQTTYQIGNNTYTGTVSIDGSADFNPVAPYFGIGWSSNQNNRGLYFTGDIGFMYIGEPKLSINAAGANVTDQNGNSIDLNSSTQFQSDLERERQSLESDFSDLKVWPLFVLGLGYRF